MYRTVTIKNNYKAVQKLVIIPYNPRPKGPAAAG